MEIRFTTHEIPYSDAYSYKNDSEKILEKYYNTGYTLVSIVPVISAFQSKVFFHFMYIPCSYCGRLVKQHRNLDDICEKCWEKDILENK